MVPDAPRWAPRPLPGRWELAASGLKQHLAAGKRTVSQLHRTPAAGPLIRQVRQLAGEGRAPRLSLNVPVGRGRHFLLVRADLERARTVAHAHGGTVNDIVLTAAAGGARSLLGARGELAPGLVLKASVAASVRGSSDRLAGNRVGTMVVPLPLSDPAAAHGLEQIALATAERKKQPPYQLNGRMLQRWMAHTMSHQRMVNLLVSDLPGPVSELRFAGVPVQELFQLGVVQGNLTVSVGALSYAGQLTLGIVGDSDAAPDLAVFSAGVSAALDELGVLR